MVQFADNLEGATTEAVAERGQVQPLWLPRIVHIRADIAGLDDATIYFGLLKTNPLPNYQFLLACGGLAINSWLAPFAALRIDQIFFLYAWRSVPRASSRVVQRAGLTFGIATPGDEGKRWLATFPVLWQEKWVAWCVEIDMGYRGRKMDILDVVLCEENMVMLEQG